ncbi:hypothetical protein D3C76_52040 [compost metagenome]
MLGKCKVFLLFISLIILSACSSTKETTPVNNTQNNTVESTSISQLEEGNVSRGEAQQTLGSELLNTTLKYLSKDVEKVTRDKLADLINTNIDLIKPSTKDDFLSLSEYIRKDEKEHVVELYNKLAPSYGLDTIPVDAASSTTETSKDTSFNNVIANLDKNDVTKKIKENGKKEWPDDPSMQVYFIKEQTEAYNELVAVSISDDTLQGMMDDSYKEWGYDFRMVRYTFQQQLEAYINIAKLETNSEEKKSILNNAILKWGTDYRMVLYEYEKQLEALEILND